MVEAPLLATAEVADLPTEALEQGICSFTARLAAATCVYLLALAEFDRRGAWADQSCRSMAHWLSWRCGMSLTTAREHLRVASVLVSLPEVRNEFANGRLTFSQVRAISRVATPENERMFIDVAAAATASQLDRVCTAFRQCRTLDPDEAAAARARRSATWRSADDGSVVLTVRLPSEDAAVLRTAIDAARAARRAEGLERPVPDPEHDAEAPWAASAADALVDVAAGYLAAEPELRDADPDRYTVTVVVEQAALADPEASTDITCRTGDGAGLSLAAAARLSCDQPSCTIVTDSTGRVLDVGRRTRRIGRRLRRALQHRDGGRCTYPGCSARRTEAHHMKHWAAGGATALHNLVSFCAFHHHRHHEGHFTVTAVDGVLEFTDRHGRPVTAAPALPPTGGATDCGVVPGVDTFRCGWQGERLDLPWVTSILLDHDERLRRPPDDHA